jgi:conserved oligomeric Golgi complex subunit 8
MHLPIVDTCRLLRHSGARAVSHNIQERHEQHKTQLGQLSHVLELLEAPQLIDTCVRTNNYDEALELITHVKKIAVVAPRVPTIRSLVEEAVSGQQRLLEQVLGKLSSNVTLPECLRCVSYLRRLAVFTERELRLRFLQCRERWCAPGYHGIRRCLHSNTLQLTQLQSAKSTHASV